MAKKTNKEKKVAKTASTTRKKVADANMEIETAMERDEKHELLKVKIAQLKGKRIKTVGIPKEDGKLRANPKKLHRQRKGSRFGRANY